MMKSARNSASKRQRSMGQWEFAHIPSTNLPRSAFDRSCGLSTSIGNGGSLVPIFVEEVLPGDTLIMNMETFARLQPTVVPLMDNLYLDYFFFSVPNRLVWDNWKYFMGEKDNPDDTTTYLVPTMTSPASTGYLAGTLHDFLGIPPGVPDLEHVSLFHRAYNLIWNEWFRDQNLQDSITVDKGDGPDDYTDYNLLQKRGKRHDYFTSCLPWPQKGDPVSLPLGTVAPVQRVDTTPPEFQTSTSSTDRYLYYDDNHSIGTGSAFDRVIMSTDPGADGNIIWGSDVNLQADLSNATAASINTIREAFQLQKMYERDARGGTRYTEIVRSHFGVVSPDARLQRPEYLGGGSTRISMHPVAQTGEAGTTPQANLSGFGTGAFDGRAFNKSFTEHGMIIGLVALRADLSYQQGLNRMFSRSTRFDYYFPSLAHLGEQAVLNKEIYAQGTSADDDVFGYQERWAEYRYKPSETAGFMRSTYAQSLDVWHLAQEFSSLPVLNSTFIQENPPLSRVMAVPAEPPILLDCYFTYKCIRPMPMYSVPGFVDHF